MSNWTIHKNPNIQPNDISLLKAWSKAEGNGQGRCKVIEHNGDLIVKTKGRMTEHFKEMWLDSIPKDAIAIPVDKFFDESILPKEETNSTYYWALKDHIFSEHVRAISSRERLDWFTKRYGDFNINQIDVVYNHYVSVLDFDNANPMNIVSTVFLFYFETIEDAVNFKLTWV